MASEQNFTYIDVVRPKVAFIFDVRRQNTLLLLMYKALFEMADNRADFVSLLFSRKRPAGLDANSSADALFQAFADAKPDPQLYAATLKDIKDRLIRQHRFALSADDEGKIEYIFNVFFRGGPRMDYGFASSAPNPYVPSYHMLTVSTDGHGKNWVYLTREESYKHIRDMQQKNLIVPLVGDFTGVKSIKTVAQYVKDHGSTISVFYISNVEDYIQSKWSALPFKSCSIADGQLDAADPVRTVQLYDAGKDPGRAASVAWPVLPLNVNRSVFRRKSHDDVPDGRPIELERFLLKVHVAVSNRLEAIRLWNVADRDRVLAVSHAQDEWALACTRLCEVPAGPLLSTIDGRRYGLRTFGNHMSRDEDVLRIEQRDAGDILVTNRNLRLGAKPQVHNVGAWKDLRECKCAIGADRSFEGGGKISASRFSQCDSVELSFVQFPLRGR